MSLIDLAASEKGCITGNKGARFREGSNINKSLLALKICINALADGSKHILYRRSKLTRLLMIANVSPSSAKFKVTVNTLKYADRVKDIKINHSPAPLLSKDKSFLNAFDPEPSTPKRAAEEISDMVSASKKTRLDVLVDGNTWADHREPATPNAKLDTQCELNYPAMKPAGLRNLNSTFAVDDEHMDALNEGGPRAVFGGTDDATASLQECVGLG